MTLPTTGSRALGNQTGGMKDIIPKGFQKGRINQLTPEQTQLFGQLFGNLSPDSPTARLAAGDQSRFDEIEAPALKQFGQLQGQIASRFSGAGSGARRSSGFQNSSNQATSDFAQSLQSQRQELQRQALLDLHNLGGSLLNQRPYDNFLTEKPQKKKKFLEEVLGGAAPGFGSGFGKILTKYILSKLGLSE